MPDHHVDSTRHLGQTEALWQENCDLRRENARLRAVADGLAEALTQIRKKIEDGGEWWQTSASDMHLIIVPAFAAYRESKGTAP